MSGLSFDIGDFIKPPPHPLLEGLQAAAGYCSGEQIEFRKVPLRKFIEEAWQVVEPTTPFVGGWHIDVICDHLEAVSRGEIERLLINMPPRHMKSLLVSVFWQPWVWTFDPSSRWLTGSYDIRLSQRDVQKARRVIMSPWYQHHWGRLYRFAADQNEKKKVENSATGFRQACSTDSAATGEGGNYIICDDPLKAKDAHSPTKMQAANDWWNETMSSRANPGQPARFVVNMQRLHEKDLSGVLLEKGTYTHLCLPAEYEPKVYEMLPQGKPNPLKFEDPRNAPGELLWPQLFASDKLEALAVALGPQGYASQYQQLPAPAKGLIFSGDSFREYHQIPIVDYKGNVTIGETKMEATLLSADCAFKDADDSDYVVIQVWGKAGAQYFLIDQTRAKLSFTATVEAVANTAKRFPGARAKLIEDKANGTAVIDVLSKKVSGLIPIKPTESKESRAWSVQPLAEAGNIVIPAITVAPWIKAWKHEVTTFPRSANDDQVDAFTQAINYWQGHGSTLARLKAMAGL